MKKLTIICSMIALTLSVFAMPIQTVAAEIPPAVIAVVDMQKIQESSTAYKSLVKQRDKYVAELQAEVSKEEASLRKLEQEISKKRATLTQDELSKEVEKFRSKVADFQQQIQGKQEAIYKSFVEATTKLQKEGLNPAVSEVAEKKGANMITGTSVMIQFAPEANITEEVAEILNKKMPKITMAKPKPVKNTKSDK